MELLLVIGAWLGFSVLVGRFWAAQRGRDFDNGFLVSLLLSPIAGLLIGLLIEPDVKQLENLKLASGEVKRCPYCAEIVRIEARVCRYCNREIPYQDLAPKQEGTDSTHLGPAIQELHSGNPDRRVRAIGTLELLGTPKAIDTLKLALLDKDSDVRVSAARALGNLKAQTEIGPLAATLNDKIYLIRAEAATALGKLGTPEARKLLAGVAETDNSRHVREVAKKCLAEFDSQAALSQQPREPEPR